MFHHGPRAVLRRLMCNNAPFPPANALFSATLVNERVNVNAHILRVCVCVCVFQQHARPLRSLGDMRKPGNVHPAS